MSVASRTAIFGILVTTARALAAREMIALARPLGISASNVKSHLTRMVADGTLLRRGQARLATYEPSSGRAEMIASIAERLSPAAAAPWDSSWLLMTIGAGQSRTQRTRVRSMLWFEGYRAIAPSVMVRPAWPLPWMEKRAVVLAGLAGGVCVRGEIVVSPAGFDRLYDLSGLDSEARRLCLRVRRLTATLVSAKGLTPRKAFAARIRIGGEAVQLITHDPRLPSELWGARSGMQDLIGAYAEFEEAVREPCSAFIQEVVSTSSGMGKAAR